MSLNLHIFVLIFVYPSLTDHSGWLLVDSLSSTETSQAIFQRARLVASLELYRRSKPTSHSDFDREMTLWNTNELQMRISPTPSRIERGCGRSGVLSHRFNENFPMFSRHSPRSSSRIVLHLKIYADLCRTGKIPSSQYHAAASKIRCNDSIQFTNCHIQRTGWATTSSWAMLYRLCIVFLSAMSSIRTNSMNQFVVALPSMTSHYRLSIPRYSSEFYRSRVFPFEVPKD